MTKYKIVEKSRGKFYVYRRGWLFWKCMNPIDYDDLYLSHSYFNRYEEAYDFYKELEAFDQRQKVFHLE